MTKVKNKEEFLNLIDRYKEENKEMGVHTDDLELFEPKEYPCLVSSYVDSCYEGFESYFLVVEFFYIDDFIKGVSEKAISTKLMKHNIYNNKIQLNKKYWQELGFKENDKISISKLEDGKIVVERIGDDENDKY